VVRYTPSRRYLLLALFALAGAGISGYVAVHWAWAWIAAGLFLLSGGGLLALALRPAIEIHEMHLVIGLEGIPWSEIRRIDQTGWNAPLAVYITLADNRRILVLHTGDLDSCTSLLRHLRRYSRLALLDGIPYRQFWGEALPPSPLPEPKQLPPARYPLLRPEDEDEVERMFQRLKTAGRIDRGSEEN
jgi:hypothetical protein